MAERFVRGDLTPPERVAFERHYVECAECIDRVALAQIYHVDTQSAAARKRVNKTRAEGPFSFLVSFPARQQALIFAVSALALVLFPALAVNWFDNRAPVAAAEGEAVIWLPATGPVEANIPAATKMVTIGAAMPEGPGSYRLSIVDVSDRAFVSGPDQRQSKGMALGLRVPSIPPGVLFAVVEQRAPNGSYSIVSRHPLVLEWH